MSKKNIYWFEVKREDSAGNVEATTSEPHLTLYQACREVLSTPSKEDTTLLVSLHQAKEDEHGDVGPSNIIADFYPTEFDGGLPPDELNAALATITHL